MIDIEACVIALLTDLGTVQPFAPADLQAQLPFIRVERFSGPDDGVTDLATISIDVFAATRPLAKTLAEEIRQRLLNGHAGQPTTAGVIDRARTLVAPAEAFWTDTQSFRRFTATYQVAGRITA